MPEHIPNIYGIQDKFKWRDYESDATAATAGTTTAVTANIGGSDTGTEFESSWYPTSGPDDETDASTWDEYGHTVERNHRGVELSYPSWTPDLSRSSKLFNIPELPKPEKLFIGTSQGTPPVPLERTPSSSEQTTPPPQGSRSQRSQRETVAKKKDPFIAQEKSFKEQRYGRHARSRGHQRQRSTEPKLASSTGQTRQEKVLHRTEETNRKTNKAANQELHGTNNRSSYRSRRSKPQPQKSPFIRKQETSRTSGISVGSPDAEPSYNGYEEESGQTVPESDFTERFLGQYSEYTGGTSDEEARVGQATKRIHRTEREINFTKNRTGKTRRDVGHATRKVEEKKEQIKKIKRQLKLVEQELEKEYNPEKGVIIKKYSDYRPQNTTKYFSKPSQNHRSYDPVYKSMIREGISVIIPFFNEPSHELQQTLHSLYNTFLYLRVVSKEWRNKPLYVCIIQDGWQKADDSMKQYLKTMFPKKIRGKDWWDYYEEFGDDYDPSGDKDATFIFEKKDYAPVIVNPQSAFKDDRKFMRMTLIIKANNRRKHNSHEWFLSKTGFASLTRTEYLFMTDAFTLYNKTCMYHLVHQIDNDKKLAAVTGRQRLMNREQQGSTESIFSIGYILRMTQLYDFEMANAVYNGAFSFGGFMPVIPGPCGLYRATDLLKDSVRDWYFGVVNEEPDKTGIVLGNLRIAEDRILSYASVIKAEETKLMAFNPLAVFYFEAETDLQKFILQRRRWINGSVAGYIYLLFQNYSHFLGWDVFFIRKAYIWILLMCQFLIYFLVSIAPAVSIRILYYGIGYFLNAYGMESTVEIVILAVILWALYIGHVFVHNRLKFNYVIMYTLLLISFATGIIAIASLLHYTFIYNDQPVLDTINEGGFIVYLGLTVFFMPFVLSLLLSGKGHSFMFMIKSFLPYLLTMNMMIAWFGSYSYARIWDLSWGNRPSNELTDITKEQRDFMTTKFKEKNIKVILAIIALNIIVFFIPLSGQLGIMGVYLVAAMFQMLFSLLYCFINIFYKIKFTFTKCCFSYKKRENEVNALELV